MKASSLFFKFWQTTEPLSAPFAPLCYCCQAHHRSARKEQHRIKHWHNIAWDVYLLALSLTRFCPWPASILKMPGHSVRHGTGWGLSSPGSTSQRCLEREEHNLVLQTWILLCQGNGLGWFCWLWQSQKDEGFLFGEPSKGNSLFSQDLFIC